MKHSLVPLAGAVLVAVAAASAGAQTASRPASPVTGDAASSTTPASGFAQPTGELTYRNVCAACHMPGGVGAQGAGFYPALARNERLESNAYPVMVVVKGLNGMPPLGETMSDQQVADVVNYVRTHFGNRYKDAVKADDVKAMR